MRRAGARRGPGRKGRQPPRRPRLHATLGHQRRHHACQQPLEAGGLCRRASGKRCSCGAFGAADVSGGRLRDPRAATGDHRREHAAGRGDGRLRLVPRHTLPGRGRCRRAARTPDLRAAVHAPGRVHHLAAGHLPLAEGRDCFVWRRLPQLRSAHAYDAGQARLPKHAVRVRGVYDQSACTGEPQLLGSGLDEPTAGGGRRVDDIGRVRLDRFWVACALALGIKHASCCGELRAHDLDLPEGDRGWHGWSRDDQGSLQHKGHLHALQRDHCRRQRSCKLAPRPGARHLRHPHVPAPKLHHPAHPAVGAHPRREPRDQAWRPQPWHPCLARLLGGGVACRHAGPRALIL
mmetsp:Transcript_56502/g.181406  ORF Transcript_56502/g.181406 Transcript_56502/m.181406 type:complete len:348 (+) Transcript_56502:1115-2158(+)